MEKLVVKNFGPIKEAEIDLTKYVIFIGDTSTGKSVLAKLIAIFKNTSFKQLSLNKKMLIEKLNEFNSNFLEEKTIIEFENNEVLIKYVDNEFSIKDIKTDQQISLEHYNKENSKIFVELFKNIFQALDENLENNIQENVHIESYLQKLTFDTPIYVPAERILYSMVSGAINGLVSNNVALAKCYKDFASKFEVARKKISEKKYINFGFTYKFNDNSDFIEFNGKTINLSQSSSGIQSLVPLLLVLDNELSQPIPNIINTIVIEEPELNLFPIKQKRIIEFIVEKGNFSNSSIIITTHSPYILSALDTLILAKNTFNEHHELKEEISNVVSEEKWIDYNDISVYEVRNDGKVYSIKNDEFKSIDANAIDIVSDVISEEFDKLNELRYVSKS